MEKNSEINLLEAQAKTNYLLNSKKLRKREKKKFKNLFKKSGIIIKNTIIKPEIKNNKNNNDNNEQIKKKRNPGIDLVRLLTMYLVIVTHSLQFTNAYRFFYNHERILRIIQSCIDWNNNAFILISGIVGYKTNKYSNLLYLWLMVVFYSVGIYKYVITYKKEFPLNQYSNFMYNPVVYNLYWYFTTYFVMYLFLPVINGGIAKISKFELGLVVISTLGILIFWKDYKRPKEDVFHLSGGNSALWFLTYYLTGAYIGKYGVNFNGFKKYVYCLICATIFILASFIYFKLNIKEYYFFIRNKKIDIPDYFRQIPFASLTSILKIAQSISICLFFLQIHYNKYIAKIICFFGPLAFSVYLIHSNRLSLENYMPRFFINQPRNISLESLLSFMFLKSFKIFAFCLFIDYLRHLLFSFLRIKNILLFIETKMKEKFN